VIAVLDNLLPDNNDIRRRLAERAHADGSDAYSLLAAVGRDCGGAAGAKIRIATVYYKPERRRSSLVPDLFVHETNRWLVFPHEIQGLTREEIAREVILTRSRRRYRRAY
jgi:hypothetical protein